MKSFAHYSPQSGVSVSPNSEFVATAGYDNQVILWRAKDKVPIARGSHDHLANHVRFSYDGSYLVSSGSDHSSRVWSIPEMRLQAVLSDHTDDVEMASISPDSSLIATACRDGMVRIFSRDGQVIKILCGHTSDVNSVEWSHSGECLYSSSDDGTVRLWDAKSGQLLKVFEFENVQTDTVVLAGEAIFAGNDRGEIIPIVNGEIVSCIKAHESGVKRLIFDSSSHTLVSLSYDRMLRAYRWSADKKTLEEIFSISTPKEIWARSGAFIDPYTLALGTFGTSYAICNFRTAQWDMNQVNPTQGINAVIYSHEGSYTVGDAGIVKCDDRTLVKLPSLCNFFTRTDSHFLTGGQDGCVYNAQTGDVLYQNNAPLNCGVSWKLENGSERVLIGTYSGEVITFNVENSKITFNQKIRIHDNAIKSLAVSSKSVMSVCATGEVNILNKESLHSIRCVPEGHSKIANGVTALNHFGFASVGRDLKLRLWDEFGNEMGQYLTPQMFSCKCVASSSNGEVIAVGTYGGFVCLFSVPEKNWIQTLRPTMSGISSICLDGESSGRSFLASSYDGAVYKIDFEGVSQCAA